MSRKSIAITVVACLIWGPLGVVAKAHASAISITHTRIDRGFIREMEGSSLKGYVPLVDTTNSGVTIAHGFDLGQLSLREFDNLPLDENLRVKLRPYVGLKKYTALSFLQQHPLSISNAELTELNLIAANEILQPLVKYYDRASKESFLDLPPAAQTAVFSYAYQNGPFFMFQPQSKKLWECFVTQNWKKASKQLRKFSLYQSRRVSEANLLSSLS
jgi:GH24 family phage-related lysozyme (muramidase)